MLWDSIKKHTNYKQNYYIETKNNFTTTEGKKEKKNLNW